MVLEYNEEAVLEIAAGLTPSLTDVHIVYTPTMVPGTDTFCVLQKGRPPWQGFYPRYYNSGGGIEYQAMKRIHLKCWSLSASGADYFQRWEERIVFCGLRTLHLWEVSAETLALARNHQFTSLKTLTLHLGSSSDNAGDNTFIDETAALFFSEINCRLKIIHLSSTFHSYEKKSF
ncbi:uncharacterized protein BDV17DRAFT_189987 [Aspergillus undulatus]|uniref:uncharacterized protein n=1 Tax=Aspergillus undulatus TaxID=1810928 RepID=UPI003CCDF46A